MLSSTTRTTLTEWNDADPIGPSVHMHIVCMLTPTPSHTVCVALSTGPGWSPLGPPLLLLPLPLLYPYPPFDVSHIPFSATLIVFRNYFHCSAIVTRSSCTALNKLVQETKHAHIQEEGLTSAQCSTCKTRRGVLRVCHGKCWETINRMLQCIRHSMVVFWTVGQTKSRGRAFNDIWAQRLVHIQQLLEDVLMINHCGMILFYTCTSGGVEGK